MIRPSDETLGTPGAVESNAGDDYHILWACRSALRLLESGCDLTLVRVEGVSRADEVAAKNPDAFLGVDLTEYYGGDSLSEASRVVFSQLKYSQRHPDRPWTASRLCEKLQGKQERCVIARLAQAFIGFCDGTTTELIVERLVIKLVSNRPADDGLLEALKAAQEWLNGRPEAQSAKLIAALPESNRDPIQRLRNATRLSSTAFCAFLRCIDFSDCNSDGRLWQRLRLTQEIGKIAPASPLEHARELYERVASEALPKVGELGLKRADVLAALGCHSEESIFPAPPRFEHVSNPIPTPDADRIVQALRAAPSRSLLAHGAGGVGKTTTALSLPEKWQPCRWVFYDCFGGGTYKDSPGDERHSPRRALLQLSNQLAIACGSPFLIAPSKDIHDLWREFRERLNGAADILMKLGESLILVIDAADNATQAADSPEDSFVVDMWKVERPENVFLLMTARSGGRAQSLQAPLNTPLLELTGFNQEGSAQHLRQTFPLASEEDAHAFHLNSHGNPRVQTYALDEQTTDVPTALDQARRRLDDIFQDYVIAALTLTFPQGKASDHLDDLSCFPRPLHLDHLVEIFGLPHAEIEKLCNSLSPGLTKSPDGWSFRDEDFDTYLRSRMDSSDTISSAQRRLAARMAALPKSDFAARHLAEYLYLAGDDTNVIALALQGAASIPRHMDAVAQVQILRRRLVLGVKSAARTSQAEALVRLTIQAADAARSDHAILKLIKEHPDLAALYADPKTISKHYLESTNLAWFGGAQLRCAGLFSRHQEHHIRAKDHWGMAEAWLHRWSLKEKSKRQAWRVTDQEIAAGAEALFRLYGPETANSWLKRWSPFDTVLGVCQLLANAIGRDIAPVQQTQLYNSLRPHPLVAATFLVAFHRIGERPEKSLVECVFSSLERFCRFDRQSRFQSKSAALTETSKLRAAIGIDFAELLSSYRLDHERIARMLKHMSPVEPSFAPRDAIDANRFVPQLRVIALLAELEGYERDIESLEKELVKHSPKTSEHEKTDERQRFSALIAPRFILYRLRATATVNTPDIASLIPKLTKALDSGEEERWRYGRNFDFYLRDAIAPLAETALACTGNINSFLDALENAVSVRLSGAAPKAWIDLASLLLSREDQLRRSSGLLERAARYLAEHPTNGQEHCEELMRAAAVIQPHDLDLGSDLFHQAIKIAKELNDDLCERLKYLAYNAKDLKGQLNETDARDLSARLVRLAEVTHVYISDEDNFPWVNVLVAIVTLHAPSGYALFTRWGDLDHLGIRSNVGSLSLGALEANHLQPDQALGLLRLGWYRNGKSDAFLSILRASLALHGLQSESFRSVLARIINWTLRDLDREDRPAYAQKICEWLNRSNGIHLEESKPLIQYLSFFNSHLKTDSSQNNNSDINDIEVTGVDWDQFIGTAPIPARLNDLLIGLRYLPGYQNRSTLFTQIRQRIGSSERLPYLQALLNLPTERVSSDEYLTEWETCLKKWRHSHQIEQWAENGLTELARRHLPSIIAYPYQSDERLKRLLALPFVDKRSWLELLAPALADWVERLEAWQLYPIASVLANGLSTVQRKTLLVEAIDHGETAIQTRRQTALPKLPQWGLFEQDRDRPFATMLFTLLGDPDTRIRWACLHALRDIGLHNHPTLLSTLVELLEVESVGGFIADEGNFLWISARAYLMIFLSRFAVEHPTALKPHVETLVRHALSKKFPHAQIRELAKRAALTVDDLIPGSLSTLTREQIEAVNRPMGRKSIEGKRRHLSDTRHHEGRFNFNPMDTLPYWYAPLGRLFNLGGDEIATMAERWVCDRWSIFGNDISSPHKKRRNQDWHLSSNDHGSLPTIEEGQTYFEYHAMLLVAGELIDKQPVVIEYSESDYDNWGAWMSTHLPTHAGKWLSELRELVPLEPRLHGLEQLQHGVTVQLPPHAFDTCLGLYPDENAEFLVIAAQVDIRDSEGQEDYRVESALVNFESAHALLRALQNTGDPHSYRIPPAGDDLEIDDPMFNLQGWISETSREVRLDRRDPLIFNLDSGIPVFTTAVQDSLGIRLDDSGRCYVDRNNPEHLIAKVEAWSDPHEDREGAEYSTGWRLKIKLQQILPYLQAQQRCLILEVQIDRKERRHGQEKRNNYIPPAALLYLLYPDGRLETLEHNHRVGTNNT
ncbi:hypothetical protein HX882_27380 [Pseudomonas gingeri]|uniref:NACHT domain-containing protein n=1 Tax=Pseudomonas gingeri TaxID=117681 RepID=A0A7Y7XGV7_9PSED|nr:hypothetical protein [Pseudomonas gingeri]NWB99607.1 hypothetical protein [Pseudomonas gingeri]